MISAHRLRRSPPAGRSSTSVRARVATDPQLLLPGLIVVEDGMVGGEVHGARGRVPVLCAYHSFDLIREPLALWTFGMSPGALGGGTC